MDGVRSVRRARYKRNAGLKESDSKTDLYIGLVKKEANPSRYDWESGLSA